MMRETARQQTARLLFAAIALFAFCASAQAQRAENENLRKYWVVLTDKDSASYDCTRHLSPQALENRQRQGVALRQLSDAPLKTQYLQALAAADVPMVCQSKWLNAVSALLTQEQAESLRQWPFVREVTPIDARMRVARYGERWLEAYFTTISQMEQEAFEKAQLDGSGVTIGVIDAGFYRADKNGYLSYLFEQERILGYRDYVDPARKDFFGDRDTNSETHGTTVMEGVAGLKPDKDKQHGLATGAKFYLARTDDGAREHRGEEDYWISAMEWMDSLGVRLINTSLGYALGFDKPSENYSPSEMDGKTSKITRAAQMATDEKGLLLVVSAGNEGDMPNWRVVSAPADAKGVLSVGATNPYGLKAGYSSVGPEFLPYMKPNVSCYSPSGTSFAAPVVTGFAACLMQHAPDATAKQVYQAIEQSAHLYPHGNNYIGYGIPKASVAIGILDGQDPKPKFQTVETSKDQVKLKVERGVVGVVFHKKDERTVVKQKYLLPKSRKRKISRPDGVKRTTVVVGPQRFEIVWQD